MFPGVRRENTALTKNNRCDNVLSPGKKFSKEFLEETIKVWQPFSSIPLSMDDAEEIAENMVALVTFLIQIEQDGE